MSSILATLRSVSDGSLFPVPSANGGSGNLNRDSRPDSSDEEIEKWLQSIGFQFNPFVETDAERDQYLANYFVEYPYFDGWADLGNLVLFARAGDGKTVLRLRMQSLYREELPQRKTFCFSYTIPQKIAESPPADFHSHLSHILNASVRHAFVLLAVQGYDLDSLRNDAELAAAFASYFDRYLGTRLWREDLRDAFDSGSIEPIIQNVSPTFDDLDLPSGWLSVNTRWLEGWIERLGPDKSDAPLPAPGLGAWRAWHSLLRRAGFQATLVLADGVDAKPDEKKSSSSAQLGEVHRRMVRIAEPLVNAMQDSLLGEGIFWKLFLPIETFPPLSDSLRPNDPIAIMHWSQEDMRHLLAARLQVASDSAITDLAQIVEADVHPKFNEWLLATANSSPRHLLHTIQQILRFHVSRVSAGDETGKISNRTLAGLPLYSPY